MSQKEVDQIGIFEKLQAKELKQGAAARVLGITTRQVRRKLRAYRQSGSISLAHSARGKPGNHQLSAELKTLAVGLVREKYPDFAPTFAAEKLLELHGVKIGKETLRGLMIEAGLWVPKVLRQGEVHQWRARRACRGELVQLDGSYHLWFEDRGELCCLLAFIDDATSEIVWAEFVKSESTESLMQATLHYLTKEGRPVSLYTDRGGVYKVNIHNEEGALTTQYERALSELSIGLIHARSPQAKGRVERLFGTLQDRLVKELRLAGISTMAEANIFLQQTYLPVHNTKFAVPPQETTDLHRSIAEYDLPAVLCVKETRVLQSDWCLSYQNRWLQLDKCQSTILAKREKITVSHYLDGSLHLSVRNIKLTFKELLTRPTKQVPKPHPKQPRVWLAPPANHPWRQPYPKPKEDISIWPKEDISIWV